MAFLLWLRHTADAFQRPRPVPPPPPLDFRVVLRNFPSVHKFATGEAEVRRQLGTPTRYVGWGGEMAGWEDRAELSNRHFGIPRDRAWWVWADPADEKRWVAVLVANGRVYARAHQGTEPPSRGR